MPIPPMKHINNNSITLTNNNTVQTMVLAKGVLNPDPYTNQNNVKAGSIIGDIHLFLDIGEEASSVNGNPQGDMYMWFNVAGAQTQPTPGNEGASDLKNQIFWMEQFQLEHVASLEPWIHKFRTIIRVPKWARQLNKDDQIEFVFKMTGMVASQSVDFKEKSIYKEYFP